MNLELKDKIVLVTGSAQGLGFGIIRAFLNENAKVVLTDIDKARIENAKAILSEEFDDSKIISFVGDLTNINEIKSCVEQVKKTFGKIDILVANLGSGKGNSGWNIQEEDWDKMFNLNFNGARRIVQEVVPMMKELGAGSIIFISSIAGIEYIGAPIHYSVAKAAVISYSKNLARELASDGIRVNTICPGNIYFENGTWDLKLKENKERVLMLLQNTVPQNRFTSPEEIANLVLFVSSEKLKFMTGSCIIMDGGQTVTF